MKRKVLYISLLTLAVTNVYAMDNKRSDDDSSKKPNPLSESVVTQNKEGMFRKFGSWIYYSNEVEKAQAYLKEKKIDPKDRQITVNRTHWAVDEQLKQLKTNREKLEKEPTTESLLVVQKQDMQSYRAHFDILTGVKTHDLQLTEDKYNDTYKSAQKGQEHELDYLAQAIFEGLQRYDALQQLMNLTHGLKLKTSDIKHTETKVTPELLSKLLLDKVKDKAEALKKKLAEEKKQKAKEKEETAKK